MDLREDKGFLSNIKVLDLADEKASFCSKLLADLGAYVLKVERPGGDSSRRIGPFIGDSPNPERSLFFFHNNTNKLGITLNFDNKKGRKIFLKLVKGFDVMVETYPPGYLNKLELGYENLRKVNPKLILVSVTGFGHYGPRSNFKSCDLVASAFGGQMYVSGSPQMPPLKPFGEQSYYTASLFAAISILLALRKRERSGVGDHIEISLQEAVASSLEHVLVQYFYEKVSPKRRGNLHWDNSFCILPCKDGYIFISLFQQWETLIEWMDSEGMAGDLKEERYREEEFRLNHLDHIIEVFQRWTKSHTRSELFEIGQLMRFPWAPIFSPEEVLENPHLKARDFFVEIDHPEIGLRIKYPGIPYRFSLYSPNRWRRAPLIGEDNHEIYRRDLGFSDDELKRLSSLRVI